jgi:large subunit ribosomal protein L21
MFAIIQTDGRQIRVSEGDLVDIDLRESGNASGTLTFDQVLLANAGAASVIGRPVISGATVTAEVVIPLKKGEKLEIQKLRRRHNSRRHTGHRQKYTRIKITGISVPGLKKAETSTPA